MHRKGDVSTTQQVIFALLFTIFMLGLMMARLDFSMRGRAQPEILAITASSALDALSGMEKGSISIAFDRPWDITLTGDILKFESEGKEGEAGILGSVREARISGADKIRITKEKGRPVELAKAED